MELLIEKFWRIDRLTALPTVPFFLLAPTLYVYPLKKTALSLDFHQTGSGDND